MVPLRWSVLKRADVREEEPRCEGNGSLMNRYSINSPHNEDKTKYMALVVRDSLLLSAETLYVRGL